MISKFFDGAVVLTEPTLKPHDPAKGGSKPKPL